MADRPRAAQGRRNAAEVEAASAGASPPDPWRLAAAALKTNYEVPDQKIKVVVDNGWVTLEGEIEWQFQKEAAMNAVRYLTGVIGATNKLTVKARVFSSDVKNKIEAAFKRSAEIDARRLKVEAREPSRFPRNPRFNQGRCR